MKKLIVIMWTILSFLTVDAANWNFYYDGFWHDWEYIGNRFAGSWNDLILYNSADGIENYTLRVTIDNPQVMPNKKQRKEMLKTKQWIDFTGTVEYFICDDYPTAYDIFKKYRSGLWHSLIYHNWRDKNWNQRPTKRVKKNVRIQVAPFKNNNIRTYNIWWDNVGLGITLDN